GPRAALHLGVAARPLLPRPRRHGRSLGPLEQHAFHGDRPLCHQAEGTRRMNKLLTRRRLLVGGALGAGAATLGGYDALEQNADVDAVLHWAERLTMRAQRLLLGQGALARE